MLGALLWLHGGGNWLPGRQTIDQRVGTSSLTTPTSEEVKETEGAISHQWPITLTLTP